MPYSNHVENGEKLIPTGHTVFHTLRVSVLRTIRYTCSMFVIYFTIIDSGVLYENKL